MKNLIKCSLFLMILFIFTGCSSILKNSVLEENDTVVENTTSTATVEGAGDLEEDSLFSIIQMAKEREYDTGNEVLELSEDKIVLAPYNYTSDDKDLFKDQIMEYEVAEDAEFYTVTENAVTKGEEETSLKISCGKVTCEEMAGKLEYGIWAYVWFNEDDQAQLIIAYGCTTVSE